MAAKSIMMAAFNSPIIHRLQVVVTKTQQTFIYESDELTALVSTLHQHMKYYGYQNVQLPALADVEIFRGRAGDQVIANLVTVSHFGRQLALRPEFTALAAHRYTKLYGDQRKTVRWQFNGSVFRETAHQANQQMSLGAELIGLGVSLADAEIVSMAVLGLSKALDMTNLRIEIGHIGLIRNCLSQFQLDKRTERFLLGHLSELAYDKLSPDELINHFEVMMTAGQDKASPEQSSPRPDDIAQEARHMLDIMLDATRSGATMGGRTRENVVRRMLQKRQRLAEIGRFKEAVHYLYQLTHISDQPNEAFAEIRRLVSEDNSAAQQDLQEWQSIIELVIAYGVDEGHISIDPGLLRDWNYYTGIVFNIDSSNGIRLGGGGRYDELIEFVGGNEHVPAVGFGYYVDAIMECKEPSSSPKIDTSILFLTWDEHVEPVLIVQWSKMLRDAGMNVFIQRDSITSDVPNHNHLHLTVDGQIRYQQQSYTFNDLTALIEGIAAQ